MRAVRVYWRIANSQHWALEAVFGEALLALRRTLKFLMRKP